MPGEFANDDDSDKDTFIIMNSSDFDTSNSLDNSRDFSNLSFGEGSVAAIKQSDGSPEKPGSGEPNDQPENQGESSRANTSDRNEIAGSARINFASGNSGGGGDRRGNDINNPVGVQNAEEDCSHEPLVSGSSTSSGSIHGLAVMDPALDINTADLWPSVPANDRNGHSDESGLSQATTAIVSDNEAMDRPLQRDSTVNPLLGATSSSSTSSSGSKGLMKSSSGLLDISSTTISTISSGVSSTSSTDTSLNRMETSSMDISSDPCLLTGDNKLEEFQNSHIDIFNNSVERFTSTPAEEMGMIELLETQDDNVMVIPSSQEEMQFVVPAIPLVSSSSSKRRAEGDVEDSTSIRKGPRLTLDFERIKTPVVEPQQTSKKVSEKAVALDKIGQFIERGLKCTESEGLTQTEEQPLETNLEIKDDTNSSSINRKLLFESSQSSSELSSISSSCVDSTFKPLTESPHEQIESQPSSQSDQELSSIKETEITVIRANIECDVIESSQGNDDGSAYSPASKSLLVKQTKTDDSLKLRYSPSLRDMESPYLRFSQEIDSKQCGSKPLGENLKSLTEVPDSELSDMDTKEVKANTEEESVERNPSNDTLIIPTCTNESQVQSSFEDSKDSCKNKRSLDEESEIEIKKIKLAVDETGITSPSTSKTIEHSSRTVQSSTRDQEVQTYEHEKKGTIVKRRTVYVQRIIIEEQFRNGRVHKKTTEEIHEDPVISEFYEGIDSPQTFVGTPVKESPVVPFKAPDVSSSMSSTERSGTSSGWLGDISASVSKSSGSSSGSKLPPKGVTPRLSMNVSNASTSSSSSSGMKTLRSVRRRQFSEFKKTLHLPASSEKAAHEIPNELAFSTPKNVETSKSKGKTTKASKTSPTLEKTNQKSKKTKQKMKVQQRNLNSEAKLPSKKKSKGHDSDGQPREQLILKLNLKSSSIVSSRIDDSRTLKPDVRVMAKYRDGYYYPGRAIAQERTDRWKILYDDGDVRSIRIENILVVDLLPVGQSIYVLSTDGFYDSAIISGYIEVNNEIQYAIEVDGGTKRQVKHSEVILTTDQAACMEKVPLGTMHGYTSICLDNIIEGKRRSRDLPPVESFKSSRREKISSPSSFSANEGSSHSSSHNKSSNK